MGKLIVGVARVLPLCAELLAILWLGLAPFLLPATIPSVMAASLTWTSTSAPPITMSENAVVANNNRLYLVGGWGPGNNRYKTVYSAVIKPDKSLGSWTETTALPVALADHAATVYNGHLYVIGGHDGSGSCVRTVYYASFQTDGTVGAWQTTTALPVPNCYSTAIVYNGYLLVVGGQTSINPSSRSGRVYRTAFQADGTLGTWGTTTSLPEAMTSYGSAVVDKGWLYVLGGHTYSTYAAQLTAEAQLGSWKATTPLPSTMNLMWATGRAAISGSVYAIAGGKNGKSAVYQTTASNGSLGNWTAVASISSELVAPAVTTYNGVVYVIGGRWETGIRAFYAVLSPTETSVPPAVSRKPEGKAPNLIVLVHGCCTDADGVKEWDGLGQEIAQKMKKKENWEIVVWDWTKCTSDPNVECTPKPPIWDLQNFLNQANIAYKNAFTEGEKLADAIRKYPNKYKHIHLIAHSAGVNLIDVAAKGLKPDYIKIQNEEDRPFIQLTFLDAYTPNPDQDKYAYGFLSGYPKHYTEHYVDRWPSSPVGQWIDTLLLYAFNFDITNWNSEDPLKEKFFYGHQWPRYWYMKSVKIPGFSKYGYTLSLEGGNNRRDRLAVDYPPGGCIRLENSGKEKAC